MYTIALSITSALLASIVSPLIVFLLNERQRQLEIYKIEFKAIKEFMVTAHDLEIEVINAHHGQPGSCPDRELVEKIKYLRREADANEWLFGPDLVAAIQKIGLLMMDIAGPRVQLSGDVELVREFRELNVKLADELQMTEICSLFIKQRKG